MNAKLSDLPAIDEILRWPQLADAVKNCGQAQVTHWAREAVNACRAQLRGGCEVTVGQVEEMVRSHVLQAYSTDQSLSMQTVINATGVLLHTNIGRAPLPQRAAQRVAACTQYTNLEMDFSTGKRNHRGERVCRLLARLTGAEDAIVVNNCAAATMLVLAGVAFGKEVIVSRGQLVEIGGGFRLPEVFASAGVILREVGTTNRTYLRDYQNACGENTGAIIRVSRSNFSLSGFTTEPTIGELAAVERPASVPVIDDMGSGCMVDLNHLGIDEPTVGKSIDAGSDLCLFSGDKLFGGPQAGIILGRKTWIAKLRKHPMMRAMRLDKMTLAALEATTEIHLDGKATDEIPFYQMLALKPQEIQQRCQSVVEQLAKRNGGGHLEVVECEAQVGGGSLPNVTLPSFGISIGNLPVAKLASALRKGTPPILGRQVDDRLLLDLRTVTEDQLRELPSLLTKALTV